jgi:lipopolysaccharide transport system ATP-binding protein
VTAATNSIEVQGLCKRYRLGGGVHSTQFRETITAFIRGEFARDDDDESIWALRDVSFQVPQGEVVGIIGRNGAGKSTLLKILSRITRPTLGSIKVRGRVSSLLEVGTGFHDELTGRENVYLNGSILGMRKREVDERFDQIVDFAGVERFLDTPIKRYSSGMRLRLGFAVAAHLDPDVLIVDEILAVGDAGFQKKCLAAMEGLHSGGRTVLFVSHNMAAVENLCSRGIWIDAGRVRMDGSAKDVIGSYLASYAGAELSSTELQLENRVGTGEIRFTGIEYRTADGTPCTTIRSGESITLRLYYHAERAVRHPSFGLRMYTTMGSLITETSTWHHGMVISEIAAGDGHIDLEFGLLNLLPGRYSLSLWITSASGAPTFDGDVRTMLDVEVSDIYGSGKALDSRYGIVYFPQRWKLPA